MKRNPITIIELIIILCVIVVAVGIWTYKKPENKSVYIPTSKSTASTCKPTVIPTTKNELCHMCGKYNLIYIDYLKVPYTGDVYTGKVCAKCKWCSFKCPNCGSDLTVPVDQYPTLDCKTVYLLYAKCKKCDWQSEPVELK